jgi:histone H3/H4
MYDVEQFFKEAGAEKIHERAIISLERELQDTVNELVYQASIYANYAGRRKLINISDVKLANRSRPAQRRKIRYRAGVKRGPRNKPKTARIGPPKIMLVNDVPVVKQDPPVQL